MAQIVGLATPISREVIPVTAPNPRYCNQPLSLNRPTIENQRFFDVNDSDVLQLIEYCYAWYASLHNVELVQLVVHPDAILCSANDLDGKASKFISEAHNAIVRALNTQTGHSGPMIKPGPLYDPVILDKKHEIQELAEVAASPTIAIQRDSIGYPGAIFTIGSRKLTRRVRRPDCLNPKTYPMEEITYTRAKPQLQKKDSWTTIRKRHNKARLAIEARNRQALLAAGKRYIGIDSPKLTKPGVVHKERLSPPIGPRYRGATALVETARKQQRHFRREYRNCLLALRAGRTEIVWPPGTNFHHNVNGFPRRPGDWLNPPPP